MTSQQVEAVNKELIRYSGRTLSSGGDKSPLTEFKGHLVEWDAVPSNFGDSSVNVVFKFDKVEVIALRNDGEPYPYDTAEITVKHSSALRSVFGFLSGSMNTALNIPTDEADLDLYVGKNWHWRTEKYNWGKIPNSTVADENGDTWGDIWQASLAGSQPTQQTTQATGQMTGEQRALEILNGKNKADFLTAALTHDDIKGDSSLVSSIINETWLAGQIASGKVTENQDGTYTVS